MRALLDYVQPMQKAKYVKMFTFYRPSQAVGQRELDQYSWPYYEALTIEEAANDLAMLVTGIFGWVTPPQHGAPFRLVIPWKYGFKSIKSIVKMEFVEEQPGTFWSDFNPNEYTFTSNVDPDVPHPRWSQAMERDIGTDETLETLPFNGYGEWVAHLYNK
jgi:sulfoxide reductase catalytic subunit YedY